MVVNHSVSPGCENLGKEVSRMYGYVTFSRVGLELSTSLVETSHLTKAFFFLALCAFFRLSGSNRNTTVGPPSELSSV